MTEKRAREFTGRHMAVVILAFFGVVIAVNVAMAVLAGRTWTGLEVPNSYVASQHYNGEIATARAQAELGWESALAVDGDNLVLTLTDADGNPVAGAEVTATLRRPVHERDDTAVRFIWRRGADYQTEHPANGVWDVDILAEASGDRRYRRIFRIRVGG